MRETCCRLSAGRRTTQVAAGVRNEKALRAIQGILHELHMRGTLTCYNTMLGVSNLVFQGPKATIYNLIYSIHPKLSNVGNILQIGPRIIPDQTSSPPDRSPPDRTLSTRFQLLWLAVLLFFGSPSLPATLANHHRQLLWLIATALPSSPFPTSPRIASTFP
jgi:hypothetical protein